jgi:DNA-binding GntR family transcriptional regulator
MVQTRKQFAYERLRERLKNGKLLPGDRLAEVNLAREMRVSRGPLREAINQLASEGLIQQVPGLGAYVLSPDAQEINDIYDTRAALECFAAEKAAERISADGLQCLQEQCDRMRELLELYRSKAAWTEAHRQALLDADTEFHVVIAQASQNTRIIKLLADYRLLQRMLAYSDRLGPVSSLSTRSWAWGQHMRILRALRMRDAQAARHAMAKHAEVAKRNALAAYEALQDRLERTIR